MKDESAYGARLSDKTGPETDETRIELLESNDSGEATPIALTTRKRRRAQRAKGMWFAACAVVAVAIFIWTWYLRPRWQDEWELRQGFLAEAAGANTTFEAAKTRRFDGVRIQALDPRLIPGGTNDPHGQRRLVFVGDIHGCADELKHLLRKLGFDEARDHLVAVGDVISKGPKNAEVLDELIRLGASSVRGNHEDHILKLAPPEADTVDGLPDLDTASRKGKPKDRRLLRELSAHHLRYLRAMPLILRVPALPQPAHSSPRRTSPIAEDILVVHAGLVPAVPLARQDPYFVMNMRAIRWKTHVPLVEAKDKKRRSKPWHRIWEWYNDRVFRGKSLKGFRTWEEDGVDGVVAEEVGGAATDVDVSGGHRFRPKPQVVVYGHHSKAGLKIERWSKGLDTGCVKGERLTAMVLDAWGGQELVSVKCKGYD